MCHKHGVEEHLDNTRTALQAGNSSKWDARENGVSMLGAHGNAATDESMMETNEIKFIDKENSYIMDPWLVSESDRSSKGNESSKIDE